MLVLLSFLGGCAIMPKDDVFVQDQGADTTTEEQTGTSDEKVDTPLVPIPNPYLANPPDVPKSARVEFAAAIAAMNAGEWKRASGLLTLMTETYPTLSGPYVNLGLCYFHREDWDNAEKTLQKAIEVNNTNMDAYTALGVLYREQGKFTEAEKTYQAALSIWPHHLESHRNLGILYDLYMGRFMEALDHYRMLQALLPEEDRQLKGWIIDLERRINEQGSQQP